MVILQQWSQNSVSFGFEALKRFPPLIYRLFWVLLRLQDKKSLRKWASPSQWWYVKWCYGIQNCLDDMVCNIVLMLSIKFYVGPSIAWKWPNKLYVTDIDRRYRWEGHSQGDRRGPCYDSCWSQSRFLYLISIGFAIYVACLCFLFYFNRFCAIYMCVCMSAC